MLTNEAAIYRHIPKTFVVVEDLRTRALQEVLVQRSGDNAVSPWQRVGCRAYEETWDSAFEHKNNFRSASLLGILFLKIDKLLKNLLTGSVVCV